ncbi:hypothetical protein IAT38_000056 [Cryptococcus sp. DSM 104549]
MARACTVCGSRRWKKDRVTGNAVCEDGHVLQDYRSEALVIEGGVNYQVQKRRAAKKAKKDEKEKDRKNPELYHGEESEYLKHQALQLLLRLQVQALSKLWSLPEAYELVVRDLWAYQLAISSLPPLPERPDDSDARTPTPSPQPPVINLTTDINMDPSSSSSESDSQDDSESDPDVDPELLAQLSDSDKDDGRDDASPGDGKKGEGRWKKKRRLKASDTIITLMVGLWVMRVPIMAMDMENLVNENKIPYLDFGHTTHIPDEMRKHINREAMNALSPSRSPTPMVIHQSCKSFARTLSRRFNIDVPEINLHPVAWRIISSLGGTPTTYTQSLRLLSLLDINLTLVPRNITLLSRKSRSRLHLDNAGSGSEADDVQKDEQERETYERARTMYDALPPEVSIVAAWVVVMKLAYGLDGRPREALLSTDPAIGLPEGESLINELRLRIESGALQKRRPDLSTKDFAKMEPEELDSFLDECEALLLDHRPPIPEASHFPLPVTTTLPPPIGTPNSWHNHHRINPLIDHTPIPVQTRQSNKPLPLMPGEKLRSYDASNLAGELPEPYSIVLQAAALVTGWDKADISKAVEVFERKLERVRVKRGRERNDVHGPTGEREGRDVRPRSRGSSGTRSQVVSRENSRTRTASRSGVRPHPLRASKSLAELRLE